MTSILNDLTPRQRAAATSKTKTLSAAVAHRLAAFHVPPGQMLAVTFTNKAAGEMTSRIRATLGDELAPRWAGSFRGLGARQLRIEPEVADLRPGFDILDADDSRRMVKRVIKAMNLEAGAEEGGSGRDPLKLVSDRIGTWKDELVARADAPAAAESLIAQAHAGGFPVDAQSLRAAARVCAEYQRTLRDANAADFGDLLLWPVMAMLRDRIYRARWAGRFG